MQTFVFLSIKLWQRQKFVSHFGCFGLTKLLVYSLIWFYFKEIYVCIWAHIKFGACLSFRNFDFYHLLTFIQNVCNISLRPDTRLTWSVFIAVFWFLNCFLYVDPIFIFLGFTFIPFEFLKSQIHKWQANRTVSDGNFQLVWQYG